MAITEGTQPTPVHATGLSATTASFTPEANSLLVALVAADGLSTVALSVAVSDSLSGSWTLLKRQNTITGVGGSAEIWIRDIGGSPASMTVTANWNTAAGTNGGNLTVRTLIGALPVAQQTGATGGNGGSSVAPTCTLTPTQLGSLIYGAALDYTTNATLTANANTSSIDQFADATNGDTWATFKAAADTSALSSTSYGYTNANAAYNIAAAEVLATPTAAAGRVQSGFHPGRGPTRARFYQSRQPFVETTSNVPTTADTGLAAVGLSATTAAVRVAVVTASAGLGLSSTSATRKVAPQTGATTLGLSGNAVHVQIAADTGLAALGLAAVAGAKKVAAVTGRAALGLAAAGTAKKVAKDVGTSALGLAAAISAAKVAKDTGAAGLGLAANASRVPATADTGVAMVGLSSRTTAKKVVVASATASIGCVSSSTTRKVAKSSQAAALGVCTLAAARKVARPAQAGYLALVGRFTGIDIRATSGRASLGLQAQQHQCITYRSDIGATIRPDTGTTTYATVTTFRPSTGITVRPDTGVTEDPC